MVKDLKLDKEAKERDWNEMAWASHSSRRSIRRGRSIFVSDVLANGSALGALTVADSFANEAPPIESGSSYFQDDPRVNHATCPWHNSKGRVRSFVVNTNITVCTNIIEENAPTKQSEQCGTFCFCARRG